MARSIRQAQARESGPLAVVATAVFVLLFLFVALQVIPTSSRRPWDFETYWYATSAASAGLSPYDTEALSRLAQRPVGMPFIYAPVTVLLLMPLTMLPIASAALVWFWSKALLLAGLTVLWRRRFLPEANPALIAAVAVFGFNAAAVWDLATGNVAIIEQALLWSGFAAYVADRRRLFAGFVVAAALFKLFPILFLALLLVPSRRSKPRRKLAGIALASFIVLVFGPVLTGVTWGRGFLRNLPAERPWGEVNPSALGLIDTLAGSHSQPLLAAPYTTLIAWIAYTVLVLAVSVPTLRGLWRRQDPQTWIFAAALLYALLVPRMMVYTYLLVLVPVLALVSPIVRPVGGMVVVAALLVAQALAKPCFGVRYQGTWSAHLAFLMLLGFWLVYVAAGRAAAAPGRVPNAAKGRRGV
jgi:hypothetical protein